MANLLEGLITRQDITELADREDLIFSDDDRVSVLEAMGSIDVQACPGSGKTTLIAAKLILLAKKWPFQDRGICVLSHTNIAKDEIVDRIKKSKSMEAKNLLSYPHFIGTIQEFVNRYMALPCLRSKGIQDITVDNDEYVKVATKLLEMNQFAWFRGTLNGLGARANQNGFLRETYRFATENGTDINISKRPRAWSQPANFRRAQASLMQLKKYLDEWGFYLYRDMFTHADLAVSNNANLPQSIATRFPCAFLDEMQDTQEFQDALLLRIFPLDEDELSVQRFGDPDQGIFHGINGEKSNSSFNGKNPDEMDFVIDKSHRFDNGVADKVKKLSFNEVDVETELSAESLNDRKQVHADEQKFEHTVIIYDDETIGNVIPQFAGLVSLQFSDAYKITDDFSVKVVGAVGNEIDPDPEKEQLKIGHYWPEFDKAKSKKSFKEETLIEAVHYCRQMTADDWASSYKLLTDCFLKLIRSTGKKDPDEKYFSSSSMRGYLKDKGKWKAYRELTHALLNGNYPINQEFWDEVNRQLLSIYELNAFPALLNAYLSYQEEVQPRSLNNGADGEDEDALNSLPDNMIRHKDGFSIELSTIHGVKGETHDATLVLETKNHCFDLGTMLPYLTGELPNDDHPNDDLREDPHFRPAFKANKKFMRQLYVAMSRPRHLLCLAIHAGRITPEQKASLIASGWKVPD